MTTSFNLVTDRWIPCTDLGGRSVELGIRETLINAHQLRGLSTSAPMESIPILRLLLCVLHRVFGPRNESEWFYLWRRGHWDEHMLNTYLDEWQHRFELFGADEKRRFCQVKPQDASEAEILHAIAARDGGATLFNHETNADFLGISFAEAARTLLAAQCFRAGGRTKGSGTYLVQAPCLNRILYYLSGRTFFETLMLNLLGYPDPGTMHSTADDRPSWEMDDPYDVGRREVDGEVEPLGYLDYLSWQSLSMWLEPPIDGHLIRECRQEKGLPKLASHVLDPMVHYRAQKKEGYSSRVPNSERALWRDSSTLLQVERGDHDRVPRCLSWLRRLLEVDYDGVLDDLTYPTLHAVGVKTKEGGGAISFELEEHMPLPTVYLASEDLLASLRQAMSWTETVAQVTEWAVKTMTGELLRQEATQKSGGGKRKADVSALVRHWGAMREYWGGLEPYFWELSRSLPADADTALDWWVGILKYAAWQTFEQAEALAGIDAEALKAVAAGRRQLAAGLAKVFKDAEEA